MNFSPIGQEDEGYPNVEMARREIDDINRKIKILQERKADLLAWIRVEEATNG